MPEKQMSLYLLSYATTTERADMHSVTLMDKISKIHGLNLHRHMDDKQRMGPTMAHPRLN
jgi:hypothetical protein